MFHYSTFYDERTARAYGEQNHGAWSLVSIRPLTEGGWQVTLRKDN